MQREGVRRDFLKGVIATIALGSLGLQRALAAPPVGLSPEEKKRLKEELQRELERKVYSVDEELYRKINKARNPLRFEGHERSHVPKIIAPTKVRSLEVFTVKIEVGVEDIHEMQPFHYIDWIALRVDGVQVSYATVTPLFNRPVITFEMTLEKSANLIAQEHCNLHGTWESDTFSIEVVKTS
ncbi:MAG: desulfoferrodoxin family protein [Nitrospinota bacterium]